MDQTSIVTRIKMRIAVVVFGVLGVFLFSSEFMNAVFNNRLDSEGAGFPARAVFAFKPTVIAIYLLFALLLYLLIMRYLRPLIRYLRNGDTYLKARKAAINVPWVIILFELTAWTIGTTLYYFLKGWNADSGIPFGFGLALKIAVGFPSGVYISILFNLILIPAKKRLHINNMNKGENDAFSRYRDYFVVIAIIVFIVVNFAYLAYYYARATIPDTGIGFYGPLISAAMFYGGVSFGLIALSKKEYFIQIDSIRSILEQLAAGRTRLDTRIDIINYNELGEIAGYANRIVDNFQTILTKINQTSASVLSSSKMLSNASNRNSAHASQQASGTSRIVSAMEETNSLSNEIGFQAEQVTESANRMKEEIDNGFTATKQTIDTMENVRKSNAETIAEIENLSNHIQNIWEIVELIDGIAGKIRLIAFNAAIEAASAGQAGKSFAVVASEIRTLADNTVSSTGQIRDRIEQVQTASDALIRSSEHDTGHIGEAWSISQQQESTFKNLLDLSETSSEAAETMRRRVSEQVDSFKQVLATLREISAGINEFSDSIDDTNRTADTLNETVSTLNAIVEDTATADAS